MNPISIRRSCPPLTCLVLMSLLATMLLASAAIAQVTVGEHVPTSIGTEPFNYPGDASAFGQTPDEPIWSDVIVHPGATYIAAHFSSLDLPKGDVLVIRSADGAQRWEYTEQGRNGAGLSEPGFFATHIKGDTAVLELFRRSEGSDANSKANLNPTWGFEIDRYGRGYDQSEIDAFWQAGKGAKMNLPEPEFMAAKAICGTDDSQEAKCYQSSESTAYTKSKTVARLLKNGSVHCTGWLIGASGHIMTNQHCIASQSELNSIDFEFMAEGASCASHCKCAGGCPGTIVASGGTLVAVDARLDYALVNPAGSANFALTYGYLTARSAGASVGERIYIPQHPKGWGKRIALTSSHPSDGGFAKISSLNEAACSGTGSDRDVGYFADTQSGSSGSPVLGYSDNKVVALHHCANCENRGVPIQKILTDLGSAVPLGGADNKPLVPPKAYISRSGPTATAVVYSGVGGHYTYKWWRKPTCSGGGGGGGGPNDPIQASGTKVFESGDALPTKDVPCTSWLGPFSTSTNQWQPYQIYNQNLKVQVCDVWGGCVTSFSYVSSGGGGEDLP